MLIYARYSTEDQNARSVTDQVAYCKRFLNALGITDDEVEIVVLSDHGVSGELFSRPGIDRVRTGIENRQWDLILAEDSSRLFRNETACMELVGMAVDRGIRVICCNDNVDTFEEDWEDRLYEAARHHAKTNRFTSRQIKRAHEALWEMGAAIGLLKPGYRRRPSQPATEREPECGPFFDEIDAEWAPVIEEAYLRIAGGESASSVARWLTEVGLPKPSNSINPEWSDDNTIALIQSTDNRGFQTYRETVSRKEYRTGKRKSHRNDPDKILSREMPHLRIVEDWLWHEANGAIRRRRTTENRPTGENHPLAGVPRDAHGPLSGILRCGRCRHRMGVGVRQEGV